MRLPCHGRESGRAVLVFCSRYLGVRTGLSRRKNGVISATNDYGFKFCKAMLCLHDRLRGCVPWERFLTSSVHEKRI